MFTQTYRYPLQQSSTLITLQATRSYYIEIVASNADGPNHASVGCQFPNGLVVRPIPGEFLNRLPYSASGTGRAVENPTAIQGTYHNSELLTTSQNGGVAGAFPTNVPESEGGTFGLGTLDTINPTDSVANTAPLGSIFASKIAGKCSKFCKKCVL